MKWEYEEDYLCCEIFVWNHVLCSKKISDSVQQALNNWVNKNRDKIKLKGSIKMKFSNIASLCDKYNIQVLSKSNRLANYSQQNETAFKSVINKLKDRIQSR